MSVLVGSVNQGTYFAVNQLSRLLRVRLLQNSLPRLRHIKADVTHFGIHAELNDLSVSALRHLSQVVLSTGGDSTEKDLLRHAATQCHTHAIKQLFGRVQVLLFR